MISKETLKLFEKDLNTRIAALSKKLTKLEQKLYDAMMKGITHGTSSTVYWNSLIREINLIYAKMNAVYTSWSKTHLPMVYRNILRSLNTRISITKDIINQAKVGISNLIYSRASSQIVQSLYLSSIDSFSQSILAGKKNMYNLIRTSQQTLINESILDFSVATGFDLGDLRKSARIISGQFSDLLKALENEQFIQAGKYKYKPSYYAELLARTKFHQAHSMGALSMASNYGTDLMQISSHNTTTVICQEYEGKIFSISGQDKRFPMLDMSPPFHPNCLHLMFPTFESAMQVQGTLDSFSAFSKGEISRPPVPSGFIPISERGVAA